MSGTSSVEICVTLTSSVTMKTRYSWSTLIGVASWGGARYPTLNLHEDLLAERTTSGLMISKDDDIRLKRFNN